MVRTYWQICVQLPKSKCNASKCISHTHISPCFVNSNAKKVGLIINFVLVTPYGDIDLGQHWLRQRLVAWRHQTITWTNVDFFITGKVHWHSSEGNFTKDIPNLNYWNQLEITSTSPRGHWVKPCGMYYIRRQKLPVSVFLRNVTT